MGNCLTEPVNTPQLSLQSDASLSESDVARALDESMQAENVDIDGRNSIPAPPPLHSALHQRPPTPATITPTTPVVKRRQARSAEAAQRLIHALTAVDPASFTGTFHVQLRPKAKHDAHQAPRGIDTKDALLPVPSSVVPRLASADGSLTTQPSRPLYSSSGEPINPFAPILSRENSLDDDHPASGVTAADLEARRGGSSRKSKVLVTFVE